ncbi:hypothetical protein ACQ4M3_39445 [Leptolyngbya sp. AN03gr2]|uniref:hypothetical protein n=1 Tax=unclassified Leptolyngbya TaxID=2650499 RepID=UPI003D31FEBB
MCGYAFDYLSHRELEELEQINDRDLRVIAASRMLIERGLTPKFNQRSLFFPIQQAKPKPVPKSVEDLTSAKRQEIIDRVRDTAKDTLKTELEIHGVECQGDDFKKLWFELMKEVMSKII